MRSPRCVPSWGRAGCDQVKVLDATGWRCPKPVIELARLVADLPDGELVTVLHTDPAAPGDIAAWCRMRGHDLVPAEQGGPDRSVIRVRRTPGAPAAAAPDPDAPDTARG